mmetsp:Transcript_75085/g.140060  ORF Transcript_75085/g.140060 Transcript_75085/m.140060 type:complete len:171 (-) Transcript_75085:61-573(-)
MSTDYLTTGGIKQPEILSQVPRPAQRDDSKKDELFLEGYGRQFGEKMTYSIGLTYGMGLGCGSFYGMLLGIQKGGATPKLFVNSVFNSAGRYGPSLGNQSAIITMYYVCLTNIVSWIRGSDDMGNAVTAGALSGALYKSAGRSWPSIARYSAASSVFFTGIDFVMRYGYV